MVGKNAERLEALFREHFGSPTVGAVRAQAPGRMELAGNHTDHQGGKVISAATTQNVQVMACPNEQRRINLLMEGYGSATIYLDEADWRSPRDEERNTSCSIVRGMAALFEEAGGALRGFDMVTCSDIPPGAGLSSSAAFEMAVGSALSKLFSSTARTWESAMDLTMAGVVAEQRYFGKPCGAQDQMTSAHGGVVFMDFKSSVPDVSPIEFDAASCGHTFCIVDSRSDHSRFTAEFAQITREMGDVARALGVGRLGDSPVGTFLQRLPELRTRLGDRPCLRALHFYDEDRRVKQQHEALMQGNFQVFLQQARLSGASSAQYLQNVSPYTKDGTEQPALVIMGLCAHLLGDCGAWRIHGGGFGGSVLAVVPDDRLDHFVSEMNAALGYDACLLVDMGAPGARAFRL
ncbi:MAG: galactokinase [Eggerthellaceae bacterium]|nr:galactokinase [Eggerthellaceae bacterium]